MSNRPSFQITHERPLDQIIAQTNSNTLLTNLARDLHTLPKSTSYPYYEDQSSAWTQCLFSTTYIWIRVDRSTGTCITRISHLPRETFQLCKLTAMKLEIQLRQILYLNCWPRYGWTTNYVQWIWTEKDNAPLHYWKLGIARKWFKLTETGSRQ